MVLLVVPAVIFATVFVLAGIGEISDGLKYNRGNVTTGCKLIIAAMALAAMCGFFA